MPSRRRQLPTELEPVGDSSPTVQPLQYPQERLTPPEAVEHSQEFSTDRRRKIPHREQRLVPCQAFEKSVMESSNSTHVSSAVSSNHVTSSRVDLSYRRAFTITWPVMLSQLSHTAMGFIDTVMVGQLGVTALAAIGLGALTLWWLASFLVGTLHGVNTAVAQAEGAGDKHSVGVAFWQGTWLGLGMALLLMCVWPFIPALLRLIGPEPEMARIATEYMQIRLVSFLAVVPLVVADAFYRGLGRTDIPLRAAIAQLVLNCGFNYLFIFGKFGFPELGAPGTAVGTLFATSIAGGGLFLSAVYGKVGQGYSMRSWRPERAVMKALFVMSLPIGLQSFMEMGGISVFSVIIARLGAAEMAASNAVIQNWSVAFMAGYGLSVTATTLVGQCVGAGEPERASLAVRRTLRVGYVLMALMAVVYLVFPEALMAMFAHGEDLEQIRPFAKPLFRIVAICLVLDLWFMVFAGALRGAGDTAFPMWVNIASAWLLFVPSVLIVTPIWGMVAAWACFVGHLTVMSAILAWRFFSGRWIGHAMQDRLEEESPVEVLEVRPERA